jgi:uncharacterized membrane protein
MNKIIKFLRDNYIRFVVYGFVGWLYEVLWFIIVRHEFVNRGVLFGPYLPIYGFGMLILILLLSKYKSKKHPLKSNISGNIAVAVLSSFIYITIVEYTTPEKIYRIDEFAKGYGIGLLITIAVALLIRYLIVTKVKKIKIKDIDVTPVVICLLIFIITTVIEYVSHYVIDVYFGSILWDYSKDFLNLNARVNFDASRNFALGGTALMYLIEPIILKITKSKNKYVNVITLLIALLMLIDAVYSFILK